MSDKKVWSEKDILDLLEQSDKAVTRAVIAIYNRQTADEQAVGETKIHNGIGFSGADSRFLSYCAKYALRNGTLTGEFLTKARDKIKKYRKQLVQIANA